MRSFLDDFNAKTLFKPPEKMLAVEQKLRGSISPQSGIPLKTTCRSVATFHAKGADGISSAEIRALCANINHSCAACGPSLLETPEAAVKPLFARIETGFREKRLHIESWHDLMQAYLAAAEKTEGCESLREMLFATFTEIKSQKPYPFAWLPVLAANEDVLSVEPCKTAAVKDSESEAVRASLRLPDSSWYWKELTVARTRYFTQRHDDDFTAALPALLEAAHFLPVTQRDEVIRLALERSVKCREGAPNAELRRFIVDYWGAPALGSHLKYDLVTPEAKRLAAEWLLREDMRAFMALLQEGGDDRRKLGFWSRYIKSIEFHRVLLGQDAQASPSTDIAEIWSRPSAGKLAGSPPANNVLLLKIGPWIFVESSGAENPLYGYRIARHAFNPEAAEIDIPCFRKGGPSDFKALRQDSLEGMWEDRLVTELATMGIKRDETPAAKRKPPPVTEPRPAPDMFDRDMFAKLAGEGLLQVNDARPQGGLLWVVGDLKDNYYLAQKLAFWGFRWKRGQGWWRS